MDKALVAFAITSPFASAFAKIIVSKMILTICGMKQQDKVDAVLKLFGK